MEETISFPFRPWVRRAGISILGVAAALTLLVLSLKFSEDGRYGWVSEPFVAVYLAVLWLGGLRVTFGTLNPVAVLAPGEIRLRPLHMVRQKSIQWTAIEGTEQTLRGDRLVLYYGTPRGRRFVALNLNLIRGRREFLEKLEARLAALGFREKIVAETRYLSNR